MANDARHGFMGGMVVDASRIAADAGRTLAAGTIAHNLSVQARLTMSPIFPHPIDLEPPFHVLDPLQTFVRATQSGPVQVHHPVAWVTRRLFLPLLDAVDWSRAEAAVSGLAGVEGPMSFELVAGPRSASFYLGAPAETIGFLTDNWLSAFPESAIADAADPWLDIIPAVLYDLYSPAPYHRSIRSAQTISPWRHLLRLCTSLRDDGLLFCQIVFAPTRHPWQHNIDAILTAERSLGHRAPHGRTTAAKNLSEPLFAVAIRIGATESNVARSIEAFAGTFTADAEPFRYRTIDDYFRVLSPDEILTMLRHRCTHTVGQLLTSSELAGFVHPPDERTARSVPLLFARGLPVPSALRAPGIPLGVNTSSGVSVSVFQPSRQANKNGWVIGASGTGKSLHLLHKARWLAQQGYGVGLIDPHRTTAFQFLAMLTDIDPDRVVFLDFDAPLPVAFNPFSHPNEDEYGRLTGEYLHSFKHLFDTTGFHRLTHFLANGIYALFVLQENLATLPTLVAKTPSGDQLRRRVIANTRNASVRRFWEEEYPAHGAEAFAPISNRFSAILLDDQTYRTFAQHENRVRLDHAMNQGKIVIIAPPANIESAGIVGGLAIAQLLHAALRRAGTPQAATHFHLFIDEFHRFVTSTKTLQSIIDEARKGGLSVSLVNQETGQIPGDLLKAMYSIPNIFIFGINLPDAKQLAHLFNGHVKPELLAAQPTGSMHARIGTDIVTVQCQAPASGDEATAERIMTHSTAKYYATAQAAVHKEPRRAGRIIDTLTRKET